MFAKKHGSHKGLIRGIVLLLSLVTLLTSLNLGGIAVEAEAEPETVTVTVNYVYKSNNAMVAQPYTAQIEKGAAFQKNVEIPKLFNYSIPVNEAVGLDDSITLSKDETSGKYTLKFDLTAVETDVTVTLYYVAGTAKYTVYHYYQNLENDEYTLGEKVIDLTGDIDAYAKAEEKNKPGYRCKGIPQLPIAADGNTRVDIYYDREFYTVTFDVNGGVNGPEPIYAKYGTTFEAKNIQKPTRKGYTFLGWTPMLSDSDTVTITGNVTYVAQWQPEKGQADYTIVLWGQNANDDEYSYLDSVGAWGNVGNKVTWNEGTLISHVHTDDCRKLTCGKEEHTHSEACGLNCKHTHDLTCYGLSASAKSVDPQDDVKYSWTGLSNVQQYFNQLGADNGSLFYWHESYLVGSDDHYYLRLNNNYYSLTSAQFNKLKGSSKGKWTESGNYPDTIEKFSVVATGISCTHTHTDACYACGKTEHKHDSSCGTLICGLSDTPKRYMRDIKPDSKLWQYEKSETVTVDANGSTVLNVYFKRTEFTLTFKYKNNTQTITDRWGANVKSRFDAIETNAKKNGNLTGWKDSTTGYYTNNVMVMPSVNKTFTANYANSTTLNTMKYYSADLNGDYQEIFTIKFYGDNYTVTEDEYYEWEGFEINKSKSAKTGDSCRNAEFYYDRKPYKLEFYSASNSKTDRERTVKYEDSLSQYNYTPTNKPDTVESDAIFVGWYLNPECTGEPYDLAAHTMPSHNIALYAKWVNGLYTVKTFTDETMQTLYTYDGYNGVQENVEKYTLATAPNDPEKKGYTFIGWFYKEGENEKPFSFTMPITRDYNLYPKFSELTMVTYTVHYYLKETETKLADDKTVSVMIGTQVTEKAKMGTELNLLPADKQNKYYPTNTSTGVTIDQDNLEIIFYYTEAESVQYTVYYQDASGNNLLPSVTKTTEYSVVTEVYVQIPHYAPRQFRIMLELSLNEEENKIVFIYDPLNTDLTITKTGAEEIDENQTFLFRIKGTDENTKDIDLTVTVCGNGSVKITELPVGAYTVTELTSWSWRYQPETPEVQITLDAAGGNRLTFANSRTQQYWLGGDAYSRNDFNN